MDAVRTVYDGRSYVDPTLAQVVSAPGNRAPVHNGDGQRALSRREFQVLHLISDGLENQAIAKILYVSVETVRTHVKSILRKLGARDRTHAVAVAFRSGVLVPGAADPTRSGILPPASRQRQVDRCHGGGDLFVGWLAGAPGCVDIRHVSLARDHGPAAIAGGSTAI